MALVTRVVEGVRWSLGIKMAVQLVSWAATIYIIRLLTPDDFAIVAMADMSVTLLLIVASFGMGQALLRIDKHDKEITSKIFGFLIVVNSVLLVFILWQRKNIAELFGVEELEAVIAVSAVLFVVSPFKVVYHALLSRELRFKDIEIIKLISVVFQLVVNLSLAIAGYGYWALIFGLVLREVLLSVLYVKAVGWVFVPQFNFSRIGQLFRDGRDAFVNSVLWELIERVDRFLIVQIAGSKSLGIYAMAYNLAEKPVALVGNVIQQIGLASFSSVKDENEKVIRYLIKSSYIVSLIMAPVLFGISAITPELVPLLLGEQWVSAIVPMQILCIVQIFNILRLNTGSALYALGHGKRNIRHSAVALAVFSLSWSVGLTMGINEGCMFFLAGYALWFLWHIIDSGDCLNMVRTEYLYNVGMPVFSSVLMVLVILAVDEYALEELHLLVQLLIKIIIGIVVYVGITMLLFREKAMGALSIFLRRKQTEV
ncbi:oligosaccharide flippase family protein [Thiolapillus sp.]